ncbi:hypothetical protein [Brucella endophytica]|uniref:hypothetical protein n=1 Tax=Brucella endophytica TaxID=1963359 RepID=UPI001669FC93|nr:hypothetical protein [Brucella endophytica]
MTVDVPGYCPEGSGKGVHVGDDMAPSRPKALRSRRHDRKYTLEELCQLIDESINSSISERSPDEILTRGDGWKPFLYGGVTSTIKERDRFHLKVKYSTSRTTEASHGTARNDRE